jgi:hypothetical protein
MHLLRTAHEDLLVLQDIPDLEDKAPMKPGIDDHAGGIEGIGEHSEDRKVEGPAQSCPS